MPVKGFKGLRGMNGVQKFTIAKIKMYDYNFTLELHVHEPVGPSRIQGQGDLEAYDSDGNNRR